MTTFSNNSEPDLNAIRAAHQRIAPRIHRTPVLTSESLNEIAGAQLFFKCENLQKTGSFKIRGATNAVFSLTEVEAKHGVVAPSSGNHAAALSLAARWRGIPAWIVMPSNSSAVKKKAVEAYGGKITECEPNMASREATSGEVMRRTGAHLVHPYNDERVIAGQGTAALELLEDVPDLDIVIAPVSGGGLLSGTAIAAKGLRPEIRVIGGEPLNADDAFRSLTSGKIEAASALQTMADGLRATLCPLTFSILQPAPEWNRARLRGRNCLGDEALVGADENGGGTLGRGSGRSSVCAKDGRGGKKSRDYSFRWESRSA